jgi:hypothetical protein
MSEPIEIPNANKRKPRATKKSMDIEAMEEKQLKLEQALKPKRVAKPKNNPESTETPISTTPVAPIAEIPRFDEDTIINKIIEKLKIPQSLTITPEKSLTSTETTPILKKKKFIC